MTTETVSHRTMRAEKRAVDPAPHAVTRRLAPPITPPPPPPNPRLLFNITGPVEPGQPVGITWSYLQPLLAIRAKTQLSANVSILDPETNQQVTLNSNPLQYVFTLDSPLFSCPAQTAQILPSSQRAGQLLYKIGTHTLTLALTVTHPNASSTDNLTCTAILTVQPSPYLINFAPALNAPLPPTAAPPSPSWNSAYSIRAIGNNINQYCTFTILSFQITELDNNTGNQHTIIPSLTPSVVPPLGPVTVDSGPITQHWPWMNATTYLIDGPLSDVFVYSAAMVLQDNFLNTYPQGFAWIVGWESLNVTVLVNDGKTGAALSAADDMATSVSCTLSAILFGAIAAAAGWNPVGWAATAIAGALSIAAIAFQQSAQGQANLANDPPLPDCLTREILDLSLPSVPRLEKVAKELPALARFVQASFDLLSARRILACVGAKLNGATLMGDTKGAAMQKRAALRMMEILEARSKRLRKVNGQLVNELTNVIRNHYPQLKMRYEALRSHGLSPRMREALLASGLPANALAIAEAGAKGGSLSTFLDVTGENQGVNAEFIRSLGSQLVSNYTSVQTEAKRMAKGTMSDP